MEDSALEEQTAGAVERHGAEGARVELLELGHVGAFRQEVEEAAMRVAGSKVGPARDMERARRQWLR